jgi:hypothetical protein
MQRHEELTRAYLRERLRPGPLVVLLLLAIAYPFAASSGLAAVFVGLCGLGGLLIARAPRWLCYATMAVILIALVAQYVFVVSNAAHDGQSDRDEAVEIAAQAFLAGANPWERRTQLDARITTGPASILAAVPSVLVTGHVNAASFIFYLLLFAALCAADVVRRNDTFLPLGLFFSSGFLGVQHTLYWSLDELAWAYAALAAAWWLIERGWPIGAGAGLAVALCSRPSYAFPVFAFLCWSWYRSPSRQELLRVAAGAALGAALILLPFVLALGGDLVAHNPLAITGKKVASEWPDTNPIFRLLNAMARATGPGAAAVVKTALALAAIWYGAKRVASAAPAHPFWHMCIAALLANFLVYPVGVSDDYTIFFAIPAMLAVALTVGGFAGSAAAVKPVRVASEGRGETIRSVAGRRTMRDRR